MLNIDPGKFSIPVPFPEILKKFFCRVKRALFCQYHFKSTRFNLFYQNRFLKIAMFKEIIAGSKHFKNVKNYLIKMKISVKDVFNIIGSFFLDNSNPRTKLRATELRCRFFACDRKSPGARA